MRIMILIVGGVAYRSVSILGKPGPLVRSGPLFRDHRPSWRWRNSAASSSGQRAWSRPTARRLGFDVRADDAGHRGIGERRA